MTVKNHQRSSLTVRLKIIAKNLKTWQHRQSRARFGRQSTRYPRSKPAPRTSSKKFWRRLPRRRRPQQVKQERRGRIPLEGPQKQLRKALKPHVGLNQSTVASTAVCPLTTLERLEVTFPSSTKGWAMHTTRRWKCANPARYTVTLYTSQRSLCSVMEELMPSSKGQTWPIFAMSSFLRENQIWRIPIQGSKKTAGTRTLPGSCVTEPMYVWSFFKHYLKAKNRRDPRLI